MIAKYLTYVSLMMGLVFGLTTGEAPLHSAGATAPQDISKPVLISELSEDLMQTILESQGQSIVGSTSSPRPNGAVISNEQAVYPTPIWIADLSVAISGDTAVFGGCFDEGAYIYVRSGGGWIHQATLTPSDPLSGSFGYSVAISNDTVLVSSLTTAIFGHDVGSVYVYTRSGTTWTEQGRLFASDGAEGDDFGITVSISGETALVGANKDDSSVVVDRGSAYVYVRNGTSWTEQAHLFASDGANADYFGTSVALDGDTALIGARADDVTAVDQGSAYVFVRSGTSWIQQARLTAQDGAQADDFGISVALDNDTALVGASGDDGVLIDQGSAYVFTRNGTTWSQQKKLAARDGMPSDYFGYSVALLGDVALVGAYGDEPYTIDVQSGSAYLYGRSGGKWNLWYKVYSDFDQGKFGKWVALSSSTVLISSEISEAYFYDYSAPVGFYASEGRILDKNGNDFIIRGVNYPFASFQDASYDHSFGDIKATGANTVRVVLHNGRYVEVKYVNGVEVDTPYVMTPIEKVGGVIGLCRDNHLVCVLEVHDTTGYFDYQYSNGSYHHRADSTLAQAVDYWKMLKDTLAGTEDFIILNIGNESYGNKDVRRGAVVAGWEVDTVNAIHEMRAAGFKHMLMVDAPFWGKDTDPSTNPIVKHVMKDLAASVFEEDPERNTVFSIHIYDEPVDFQSYISSYVNAGIPLVIGEFGYDFTAAQSRQNDIMAAAQSNGIGYLGWWWSSSGYELDMVQNFDPTLRTDWGKSILSGPNGICRTSVEASIFNSDPYPVICSITPISPNPTNAASVKFSVVFSEDVTGVDKTDFTLTTTGPTGASINGVTGAGSTYIVTVLTGSGNGNLLLNAVDNGTIFDLVPNPLGGAGTGNGDFAFGDPYNVNKSFTTTSIGGQDGWILESTETSGVGGTMNGSYTTFNVGDGVGDKQYRALLSFFTAGLPDNAVITRVTLKIRKQGQVGTNPFTILGGLKVSIRKPWFGTTIGLLVGDFQAAASRSAVGTFNMTPVSNWYSAIIGSAGYPYINLLDTTQFRLYFIKDDNDDMGADYMKFFSGNYAIASVRPTLVIEYYIP